MSVPTDTDPSTLPETDAAPPSPGAGRAYRFVRTAVVIGGGLAGMAAAESLTRAGVQVTLLEASRRLGGRAASHTDPSLPETTSASSADTEDSEFDACQHVLLGCCTNLLEFYRRVGADHLLRFEPAIRFITADGRTYNLGGTAGLPAPLHLGPAFARFGVLTLAEKTAAARAMLAMLRMRRQDRPALDTVPFGELLRKWGQPESLLAKLYEPVLLGSLNEDPRISSSRYAVQVFQDALLAHSRGGVMGVSTVPLSRLYAGLTVADLRLGCRVTGLEISADGSTGTEVTGVRVGTEVVQGDVYVLATNHPNALKIAGAHAQADPRFAGLGRIQSVPILGAHLRFDRPVFAGLEARDGPACGHVAFMAGPLQWLFRNAADPRVVHGVISVARAFVGRPHADLAEEFARQITTTLPGATDAKLLHAHIVMEKRATYSVLPGTDALRPAQAPPPGGLANLYLAGDYTRTGWPATMEGAVRSGYLATEAVTGMRCIQPDLPTQWPGRLMGLGPAPTTYA